MACGSFMALRKTQTPSYFIAATQLSHSHTPHHSPLSLCEAAAAEPMEMRSSTAGGDDSPHGLMFGKKIYFEDGVGGGGGGGGGSSSSKAPPVPAVRKGRGVLQGGGGQQQPPRCQVEGCDADLSGVKAYYCRHKVCGMHSKAPKVVVGGMEQRFCQQCSRFHQLTEFDQGKRSCRRRLAGHNERRRKPPLGPFASRYEPSRFRSFLMDFGRPKISGAARDIWPAVGCGDMVPSNQWHGMVHSPPNAAAATAAVHRANPYFQGSPGQIYSSPELPPGKCIAGATGASCALSLLSTQPWENTTTTTATAARSQAPAITESTSFGATQMAHPFMFPSNYMANSWGGFRNPVSRNSSSRQTQHETGTSRINETHFSGELELALQGNGQCPDHGMGREYDHSGHVTHWSL